LAQVLEACLAKVRAKFKPQFCIKRGRKGRREKVNTCRRPTSVEVK
jgi:hypothetical protein